MRKKTPLIRRSFWARVWEDIEPAARAFVGDIVLFVIVLTGMTIVFLMLEGIGMMGYPDDRLARLETIHYWVYVIILIVFWVDLILKIAAHVLKKDKENEAVSA